ncbi:MAG TPA: hypothetical protein VIV60_26420 [Polyangiaceae bacterium]
MRPLATVSLLAVCMVAKVVPSLADSTAVSQLDYLAPESCPDRAAFFAQLVQRSQMLSNPEWHGGPFVIQVRVTTAGAEYTGQLRWSDATGVSNERIITGSRCSDVTIALALAAALRIDAFATTPPSAVPAAPPPSAVPAPHQPNINRANALFGAVAGMHTGIAPTVVPTLGLSLALRDRTAFGGSVLSGASLRLEGLYGFSSWRDVEFRDASYGHARFQWFAARAAGCAFQAATGPFSFGPCATLELGGLRGSGKTTRGDRSDSGWWLAPGAVLDAALRAGPLWTRLAAGAVRPIVRDSFQFSEEPQVFRAPKLALVAELELAWAIY